jgi:hypothetical protein
MLVAAFGRHANDPFREKELALTFACIAALFLFVGSTRYGVDTLIKTRKGEL